MKSALIFCFFLLGCNRYCENKSIKLKALRANPPGTIHIGGNLYMDQTEIANIHWSEYVFWIKNFDSLKLPSVLTDTLVWLNVQGADPSLSQYYHQHPGFNNYPAVGISYEQAVAFAQWRSDRVNENKPDKHRNYSKVRYRLPTKKEWERVAADGFDIEKFPFGFENAINKYGMQVFRSAEYFKSDSLWKMTSVVQSFCPNSKGFYQFSGNLSEMVAEKNIAKGGNFLLPLDSCKIRIDHLYTKPEAWLGFRLVCEIIE